MIDVVVVNWNSAKHVGDCLMSIKGQSLSSVVVVDNGSADDSLKVIEKFNFVSLIESVKNLGFGRACNIGAKHGNAEFLLFLNPDAAVFSETLQKALSFMLKPENIDFGICGVQLLDESGHVARSCARFPTPIGFTAHAIGLDRIFPRVSHFMAEWTHDTTRQVDHVIGAFFLVRRSLFESLGGFDERFFVYLEDVDFSIRAKQAGWKSIYLVEAQAFHAGGGTSNQVKAKRLFYSLRSRLLYADKHFTWVGCAFVYFSTFMLEPIARSALALVRRSLPTLKETWQGYAMLWRWLPQWVLKGVTR